MTQPPKKRVRRTKAQIEADRKAEEKRREELAQERAARIPQPRTPKWKKTFHFVEDGFTIFGKVWLRGEEVTIEEGTEYFEKAFTPDGKFKMGMTPNEQIERYGVVYYKEGPWDGLPYDLSVYERGQLDQDGGFIEPTPAEIAALQQANKRRHLV